MCTKEDFTSVQHYSGLQVSNGISAWPVGGVGGLINALKDSIIDAKEGRFQGSLHQSHSEFKKKM